MWGMPSRISYLHLLILQAKPAMPVIHVVGSINYDLVTTAKRLPEAGETAYATNFETHHGGKGANQCRAIARLKDDNAKDQRGDLLKWTIVMYGKVGDDAFGAELVKSLAEENGLDTSKIQVLSNCPTGTATIFVDDATKENRILVNAGANGTWKVDDYAPVLNNSAHLPDAIVLQNEIPMSVINFILSKRGDIASDAPEKIPRVFYNPSPFSRELDIEGLKNVCFLVVNEGEAKDLCRFAADSLSETKATSLRKLASVISDDGHVSYHELACHFVNELRVFCAVITLGSEGVTMAVRGAPGAAHVPPYVVDKSLIKDTTGAGDTFLGCLVGSLTAPAETSLTQQNIVAQIKLCQKAACLAIQKEGAAESIPQRAQVLEWTA